MKLRWHYLLVILAVGLAPLFLSAWLTMRAAQENLRVEAGDNLRLLNRLIGDELNQYVANVAERLRGRSTYPDFAAFAENPRGYPAERVLEVLDRVHNIDPVNISSVALLNRRGIKLLDTDAAQSLIDESQAPWVQETLKRERGVVIPNMRIGERPFLWVTAPVRNNDGELVGLMRMRLQLAVLQQIVQRANSDRSTYAVVVDGNDTLLAHGLHPERIGQGAPFRWQILKDSPELQPNTLRDVDSDEALRASAMRLRDVPWVTATFQTEAAHNSGVRELRRVILIMMVVSLVFSAIAGLLAADWLSKPIGKMVVAAERVGNGDFGAQVDVKGPDEIQALGHAFNTMTHRLKVSLEELEKRVQETEASERRTREIVAANPVAMLVVDERGEITQLNQAFVGLYGYTLVDLQNLQDFWNRAFVEPEQRKHVVATFEQRLRGPRHERPHAESFEAEVQTKDGSRRIVEVKTRTIGPSIIVATLDLTARRHAELEVHRLNAELEERVAARTLALSNANAELESFSYAVSHDLRSPLRAIDGFSRALEEDYGNKLDEDAKDYLVRIKTATKRMGLLIDDLLKLSKVTRAELKKEPVDLSERARDIIDELHSHDAEREYHFICAPGVTADADRNLVRIALENLLHNAWKYSRKQKVAQIEFGTSERADGDGRIERIYFVRDNGAGFDMRYAGKLFGAFQRLHSPAEFEGTGIGLATVRRVVNRHGGRIWAEAEVNRGATFYFTLEEPKSPRIPTGSTHSPFPTSLPHVPR